MLLGCISAKSITYRKAPDVNQKRLFPCPFLVLKYSSVYNPMGVLYEIIVLGRLSSFKACSTLYLERPISSVDRMTGRARTSGSSCSALSSESSTSQVLGGFNLPRDFGRRFGCKNGWVFGGGDRGPSTMERRLRSGCLGFGASTRGVTSRRVGCEKGRRPIRRFHAQKGSCLLTWKFCFGLFWDATVFGT